MLSGGHQIVMRTAAAAWSYPSPELIMTTRSPRLILPSSMASADLKIDEARERAREVIRRIKDGQKAIDRRTPSLRAWPR